MKNKPDSEICAHCNKPKWEHDCYELQGGYARFCKGTKTYFEPIPASKDVCGNCGHSLIKLRIGWAHKISAKHPNVYGSPNCCDCKNPQPKTPQPEGKGE